MTRALCIRCGAIKFGAYCDCYHCGGPADPDKALSIELSDHRLAVGALERLGAVVRDIAAATPDGDLRRAAFLEMLRRFPSSFHREVAPTLVEPARALLAGLSLPTVTRPSEFEQWRAHLLRTVTYGRRAALCRLIHAERERNPAVACARLLLDEPDLVVDPETLSITSTGPTSAATDAGTPEDRQRAELLARVLDHRCATLLRVAAVVVARQQAWLRGERRTLEPIAPDELDIGLFVLAHVTLRWGDREYTLGTLRGLPASPRDPEPVGLDMAVRRHLDGEDPRQPHSCWPPTACAWPGAWSRAVASASGSRHRRDDANPSSRSSRASATAVGRSAGVDARQRPISTAIGNARPGTSTASDRGAGTTSAAARVSAGGSSHGG